MNLTAVRCPPTPGLIAERRRYAKTAGLHIRRWYGSWQCVLQSCKADARIKLAVRTAAASAGWRSLRASHALVEDLRSALFDLGVLGPITLGPDAVVGFVTVRHTPTAYFAFGQEH